MINSLRHTGAILGRRADKERAALQALRDRESALRADLKAVRDQAREASAQVAKLAGQIESARNEQSRRYFAEQHAAKLRVTLALEAEVTRLTAHVKSVAAEGDVAEGGIDVLVRNEQGMYEEANRLGGSDAAS